MPTWSVATLELTPFNTYSWPCDCIKPLVTTLLRDGCYYLLEVSEDLVATLYPDKPLPQGTDNCYPAEDFFNIDGFLQAYGWSIWNWGLGELYGAHTLRPPFGWVIHDKENRRSFVKGVYLKTGDQITTFFKSSGLSKCPDYIPAETKLVTEYFMLQRWYETKNPSLAGDMERKYKEHIFRIRRFYQEGDAEQWTRAFYSQDKSSPKV
jgi:hypothetical protein